MSNSFDYILQVGDKPAERLRLLDEIYGPYTRQFLNKVALKPHFNILEVGCGSGNTACWIAEQLGDKGKVIAVDVSLEQIKIAQRQAEQKNIKNIEFKALSVLDLDQLTSQFDVVFSRFLLVHISDPEKALLKMIERVKPNGGILACDEQTLAAAQCYPYAKAFNDSKELAIKISQKKNLDFNFGSRLFPEFKKLNLKNIELQTYQPVLLSEQHKKLWTMFFHEAKANFLSTDLISESEFDKLYNELEKIVKNEDYYFLPMQNFQAWGVK